MNLTGSSRQQQDNINNSIQANLVKSNLQQRSGMGGAGSGRTGQKTTAAKKTTSNMKTNPGNKLLGNLTSLGFTNGSKTFTSVSTMSTLDTTSAASQDERDKSGDDINCEKQIQPTEQATMTTLELIPGLADIISPDKPPVEKPMIKKTKVGISTDRVEKTYRTQISYRFKTTAKDTDVVTKMKCLMARIFQFDKTAQMLPYYASNKSNPLTTGKDIPTDQEEFQVYVPDASIHPRSKMLRMSFKISSARKLWQLKMIPGIRNYLSQYNVYLEQTYLVTLDNVKVGGLVLAHPQFTRRDTATRDLNIRLNENEEVKTPIQLTPANMWNSNGNKISTKVLTVECSKEHAYLVKQRLFTKLLNVPEEMKYSNTRYFKFLPFNASGAITDKVLRAGIYLQNRYLIQTTAITIINISSLDWVVPENSETFEAMALSAVLPGTTSKLFTSIEMGILDNKAHLLTTKPALEAATAWTDAFIMTMNNISQKEKFWQEKTGFNRPPERIDRQYNSDAQIAYANFLDQSIVPLVGDKMEDSGAKQAPKRMSYSRIVYGNTNATTENNTQRTAISTITTPSNTNDNVKLQQTMTQAVENMQEQAKQGQTEMRKSLLNEMIQIRKEHSTRTTKIEESVEVFEVMVKELHASNKEKSKEMASYERRLTQIGQSTAKTSATVEDLKKTMNTKIDKLNLTMKAFINVMSDAVRKDHEGVDVVKQQQHLLELSQLLEVDALGQEMDLEDSNFGTQEPSPGSGEALGGEGNKK